ncbi:MAG: hypothetical protein WA715_19495 [Candidatus Acidiferrum sp.]
MLKWAQASTVTASTRAPNLFRRKLIQQHRQKIVGQVIEELRQRPDPLFAHWTAGHNHVPTASCDGGRLINEGGEIMSVNFGAKRGVQLGFLQGLPLAGETGRQDT